MLFTEEQERSHFSQLRSVYKVSLLTRLINMHDEINLGLLDTQHLFARIAATGITRSKINIRDLYDLLRISLQAGNTNAKNISLAQWKTERESSYFGLGYSARAVHRENKRERERKRENTCTPYVTLVACNFFVHTEP